MNNQDIKIHPSAVVAKSAVIGDGCEIGAHVSIEANVRLGANNKIMANAVLCSNTRLGDNNTIGFGAIVGADPQDLSFDPATNSGLIIGNNNTIRELATLHRGTQEGANTTVGNDNFLMAGAHVGHDCQLGNNIVIANNSLLGGFVTIQDRVFLGGGSVYHQFIRIGEGAITQGNSGFGKDLPPFLVGAEVNRIAGVNSVGLKRSGMPPNERTEIRDLYKLFFRAGLSVPGALKQAEQKQWSAPAQRFLEFIRTAEKRGICSGFRPGERGRTND